jgi:hypothetical protein
VVVTPVVGPTSTAVDTASVDGSPQSEMSCFVIAVVVIPDAVFGSSSAAVDTVSVDGSTRSKISLENGVERTVSRMSSHWPS